MTVQPGNITFPGTMIMQNKKEIQGKTIDDSIQKLIDSMPFYVLLVDERHNIIKANTEVYDQLGLVPADLVGKYCPAVVHGVNGPFEGCPLEESVESGKAIVREVFDENSGRWLSSGIFPTSLRTTDNHSVYFHMVMDISERKKEAQARNVSSERLRSLSEYLERMVEEERQKIAHDLHDDISQVIASINAHLTTAINKLPENSQDSKVILEKTQGFAIQLLDRIHNLIYQLRPTILDDFGLVVAIEWLANNTLEISGISVDLKKQGQETTFQPEQRIIIFRVFQEIFSNIVKHSKATQVSIRCAYRKNYLSIKIKDNGIGFEVREAINSEERPRGLGLIGMNERIEYLHGTIEIHSILNEGTEIDIKIPYLQNHTDKKPRLSGYLWSHEDT